MKPLNSAAVPLLSVLLLFLITSCTTPLRSPEEEKSPKLEAGIAERPEDNTAAYENIEKMLTQLKIEFSSRQEGDDFIVKREEGNSYLINGWPTLVRFRRK